MLVVQELALEREGGSGVAVALSLAVIGQADVVLLEPLDPQIASADICRGRVGFPADIESEAMDGEGVRQSGRLEVHIQAPVELGRRRAIDVPPAGPIRVQAQLAPAPR
jgi:hypothetical protein